MIFLRVNRVAIFQYYIHFPLIFYKHVIMHSPPSRTRRRDPEASHQHAPKYNPTSLQRFSLWLLVPTPRRQLNRVGTHTPRLSLSLFLVLSHGLRASSACRNIGGAAIVRRAPLEGGATSRVDVVFPPPLRERHWPRSGVSVRARGSFRRDVARDATRLRASRRARSTNVCVL